MTENHLLLSEVTVGRVGPALSLLPWEVHLGVFLVSTTAAPGGKAASFVTSPLRCGVSLAKDVSEILPMAPVALLHLVVAFWVGAEWQPLYQQGLFSGPFQYLRLESPPFPLFFQT